MSSVAVASGGAPKISVVVPTHDTRELTLACLRAVEASRLAPPPEVVVIDDGSRDGTGPAVAERFPAAEIVRFDQAVGFTRAANRGVEAARGEIVVLLNSDTEVAPDALARLDGALDRDSRLGAAGAQLLHADGTAQWSAGCEPTFAWLVLLASGIAARSTRAWWRPVLGRRPGSALREGGPIAVDWVPGAALAIRRQAWNEVGVLDERFALYAQDLDFCVRLRRAGWGVALVPEARVIHHLGATIGARDGATSERVDPALLWTDLIRWVGKAHGVAHARRARLALLAGVRLRSMLARRTGPRTPEQDRDAQAFALATAALRALDPAMLMRRSQGT